MKNLEYRKLEKEEIQEWLEASPEWSVEDDAVWREFSFQSYAEGVMFAAGVAYTAEKLDHHPVIEIDYKKVRVSVTTHSTGGLSPYDFELARRIDKLTESR